MSENLKLQIVLFEPEIPWNTGNVGRLCVANNLPLHLIKPIGFSLEDKFLKRAGLDYWQFIDLHVHEDWEAFCVYMKNTHANDVNYWFFSKKATENFWDANFSNGDVLIFGPETRGLPEHLTENSENKVIKIPMQNTDKVRSLNLSSSVSIATYEAMRKIQYTRSAL